VISCLGVGGPRRKGKKGGKGYDGDNESSDGELNSVYSKL